MHTPVITSRQHPLVKEFRELARGADARMLLDGWHLLAEAAAAGVLVEKVAVCGPPTREEQRILDRLQQAGATLLSVSSTVLNALSPVHAPTGVVASARSPQVAVSSVVAPAPALVLAAAGLQDPGNAGASIRAAAAAGATGVVFDEASADPWSWKALRAAMGSTFHLPVCRVRAMAALVDDWRSRGVTIAATVPRGGVSMYDHDFRTPTALLVGGEGPGLASELIASANVRISIPMHGTIESLNVAVAAALVLYEAQRQRARAKG